MTYKVPIPRSRGPLFGILANTNQDLISGTYEEQSIRDIIIHAAICRIAGVDNSVFEFSTKYDPETDTIDLEIPDDIINNLTSVNLGPNIGKYFGWLTNSIENLRKDRFQFTIGEASGISSGTKGIGLQVACDAVITRVDVFTDVAGDIDIDIWKCPANNYPPTIANSIIGSTPLSITNGVWHSDTILAGWNKEVSTGDVLFYNINSANTVSLATIVLHVLRKHY